MAKLVCSQKSITRPTPVRMFLTIQLQTKSTQYQDQEFVQMRIPRDQQHWKFSYENFQKHSIPTPGPG